jgi:PAS domain S-box-containing protein
MTNALITMVQSFLGEAPVERKTAARPFDPVKRLSEKDYIVIDMLNSSGHEDVSFCVCDPDLPDLPICFASDGFCAFTGYAPNEIVGRNCRFLQGKDTSPQDVDRIRTAIKQKTACSVNLLNYRKDESSFYNEFFLSPLFNDDGKLLYYIGVQCPVSSPGPGQMSQNPGWVYTLNSHA